MAGGCCEGKSGPTMLLSCSGASNVGQIANMAAVALHREGTGKMFCVAGIGGGLESFVQSARDAASIVAIDGCKAGCVKACLERAGVPVFGYVVLTDLGIEKTKNFDIPARDASLATDAVRGAVTAQQRAGAAPAVV